MIKQIINFVKNNYSKIIFDVNTECNCNSNKLNVKINDIDNNINGNFVVSTSVDGEKHYTFGFHKNAKLNNVSDKEINTSKDLVVSNNSTKSINEQ